MTDRVKDFLVTWLYTVISNTIIIELINIVFDMQIPAWFVIVTSLVGSLIGMGVTRLIRFAVKQITGHEV
jgi:hypothetical protein